MEKEGKQFVGQEIIVHFWGKSEQNNWQTIYLAPVHYLNVDYNLFLYLWKQLVMAWTNISD